MTKKQIKCDYIDVEIQYAKEHLAHMAKLGNLNPKQISEIIVWEERLKKLEKLRDKLLCPMK